jgi:hypothetical protein
VFVYNSLRCGFLCMVVVKPGCFGPFYVQGMYKVLVGRAGLEPALTGLGNRGFIHLSYRPRALILSRPRSAPDFQATSIFS